MAIKFRNTVWLILIAVARCRAGTTMDVREMGAAVDGSSAATEVVQRAIDQCSASGGGRVHFGAGRYLIGTIQIKSNVKLLLDGDAILMGSTNKADYRSIDAFTDATGQARGEALVVAVDAQNVGIEGAGMIDGRGTLLAATEKTSGAFDVKPFLVRLIRCENASLKGIQLHNSAAWTLHLSQCKQVSVDHVSINSHGLANNDGIDTDSSQGVRISNCDIDSNDDAICMKSTSPQACRDISVTGCTLRSRCATIKLGTESFGDFENITIDHCQVRGAGLGGIKLFSVDGSHLENVAISDVQMDQVRVPIMIRLGARLKTFREGDQPRPVGVLRKVVIKNVAATNASQLGILISGVAGHAVEGISLENIRIELPGGLPEDPTVILPDKDASYPEVTMFGSKMPVYGIYARHVRGIQIKGLNIALAKPDARAACECEDVTERDFSSWNVPVLP